MELRPNETIVIGDVTVVLQPDTAPPGGALLGAPIRIFRSRSTRRRSRALGPQRRAVRSCPRPVSPGEADIARELLVDSLRTSDVLAEDSPGKFQLLLPAVAADRGRPVVQRLVASLGNNGINARVGIASYPLDGVTAAQLSARARELVQCSRRDRTMMDELRHLLASVAVGELSVLITGETGAGKELIAECSTRCRRARTARSSRLNCAAIPEPLLESELFGHERGASPAPTRRASRPDRGRRRWHLFLDEVGELPPSDAGASCCASSRSARCAASASRRPAGRRPRSCARRIRSLLDEVDAGRFRRDLYYRLGGVTFTVPPLRDRNDEIVRLARAFAALAPPDAALRAGVHRRGDPSASQAHVARQHPRAAQRVRARGPARRQRADPSDRARPLRCRRSARPATVRDDGDPATQVATFGPAERAVERGRGARAKAHPRGDGALRWQSDPRRSRARSIADDVDRATRRLRPAPPAQGVS